MIELLVDLGVPVDAQDLHGWTALHAAAAVGYAANVEVLIAGGSSTSALSDEGLSAADVAATNGHHAIADHLR